MDYIGLLGHVGVFITYFVIKEPWLVILAETFHGIVYAIVTSACISFMDARSPAGSSSKRQGTTKTPTMLPSFS